MSEEQGFTTLTVEWLDDRSNVDWHSEWHDMRLAHAREYRDRLFYQGTTYLLFAVVVVVLIASGVKA